MDLLGTIGKVRGRFTINSVNVAKNSKCTDLLHTLGNVCGCFVFFVHSFSFIMCFWP